MGWNEGLSRKLKDARGFYGVIIVSTLVGLVLNFVGVDPIKALVLAAVFNGVASVPLLFVIGRINGSTKILGANRGGALSRTLLWITFAVMAAASLALAYALVFKP